MGAEPRRPAVGFRRSERALAEDHEPLVPRHARDDTQAPRAATHRRHGPRGRSRRRSHPGAWSVPLSNGTRGPGEARIAVSKTLADENSRGDPPSRSRISLHTKISARTFASAGRFLV